MWGVGAAVGKVEDTEGVAAKALTLIKMEAMAAKHLLHNMLEILKRKGLRFAKPRVAFYTHY